MELIEDLLDPSTAEPPDVIDIGCGTAILAITALKLGAQSALGVDIDPDAVRAAHENAAVNQVSDAIRIGPRLAWGNSKRELFAENGRNRRGEYSSSSMREPA